MKVLKLDLAKARLSRPPMFQASSGFFVCLVSKIYRYCSNINNRVKG